ncbi:hypothetical protein [Hydrogenophaga sp. 5NK40-0174]|uniref:hypothetical protein n=1 Tax=Hydrogenophaga sp. 5NK40-0174 TaxID=3127649 RepID=UPI0031079F35
MSEAGVLKSFRRSAVALCVSWCAATFSAVVMAATPLPDGHVVLQEAINGCGGGFVYTAKPASFDQAQTEWLGTILSYLNNGELNHPGIDVEESTNGVASEDSVLALLSKEAVRSWAGDALTQALAKVVQGRQELHAKGRQFFETPSYRQHPAYVGYQNSRQAAFEALKAKGVSRIDRGIRCN